MFPHSSRFPTQNPRKSTITPQPRLIPRESQKYVGIYAGKQRNPLCFRWFQGIWEKSQKRTFRDILGSKRRKKYAKCLPTFDVGKQVGKQIKKMLIKLQWKNIRLQ